MAQHNHGSLITLGDKKLSYFIVDFILYQGTSPHSFYFKEITILDLFCRNEAHYTFEIPSSIRPQVITVEGVEAFNSSCVNRSLIIGVIQQSVIKFFGRINILFAMGRKSKFLQEFINYPVFNLELHGCPSTEMLQRSYLIENRDDWPMLDLPLACSIINSYCVKIWVLENTEKINMLKIGSRLATFKECSTISDPLTKARLGFIVLNATPVIFCIFCELICERILCVNRLLEEDVNFFDDVVVEYEGEQQI